MFDMQTAQEAKWGLEALSTTEQAQTQGGTTAARPICPELGDMPLDLRTIQGKLKSFALEEEGWFSL